MRRTRVRRAGAGGVVGHRNCCHHLHKRDRACALFRFAAAVFSCEPTTLRQLFSWTLASGRRNDTTFTRHISGDRSIWCSHIRTTFQPIRLRRWWFRASRRRVASILASHLSESLSRHCGNRHPCQKSPSTKTATRSSRKTKSGRPGSSRTWLSQVSSRDEKASAMALSGPVSRPLIRDMTALLVSGDMMSPR